MIAPDRSAQVAEWVNSHRALFVGDDPDAVRRALLIPLAQHLNAFEGRHVWGRLIKRDRGDHIPHDILVWKDTLEHFDVFTGAEKVEDTQAMWKNHGPTTDQSDRWEWLDVGAGDVADPPVDDPPPPPVPPPAPIDLAPVLARLDAIDGGIDMLLASLDIVRAQLTEVYTRQDRRYTGNTKAWGGALELTPKG